MRTKVAVSICLLCSVILLVASNASKPLVYASDPNKVVILRFDDGYEDVYSNAKPIMDTYGFKGVLGIITSWPTNGWAMTWSEIQSFDAQGYEIASHSVTHPEMNQLSAAQLTYEVANSRADIASHGLTLPATFIYPNCNGATNETVLAAIEAAGYSYGMACYPQGYYHPATDNSYQAVMALNMAGPVSDSVFQTIVEQAGPGTIPVILFHHVSDHTASRNYINVTDFANKMSWLANNGFTVKTMREILQVNSVSSMTSTGSASTVTVFVPPSTVTITSQVTVTVTATTGGSFTTTTMPTTTASTTSSSSIISTTTTSSSSTVISFRIITTTSSYSCFNRWCNH